MDVENKRMSQLIGSYSELDISQLLPGELALPTDHNPIFKDAVGNIKELLTGESAGYLEDLINQMDAKLTELEQLIVERVGINDSTVSELQTWSSYKINGLFEDKQDTLTAGNNITISANNEISAANTTYTAGTNVQISADNEISATDTTYSGGTNITINSNNEINCNVLNDTAASLTTTYSSSKIEQRISDVGGVSIDDTTPSTTTVYSSSKTESLLNTSLADFKELIYPIGCIVHTTAYSTSAQMVAAYGGTTWELITNKVLIGAGDSYSLNATGGSSSVTLTTSNLPSHNHSYMRSNTSTGSTTLSTNQMPNHTHGSLYQAHDWMAGHGSYDNLPMVLGNESIASTTKWDTASTGGSGSHYHSITRSSATSGDTGSGTSFSIINPYRAVYIWTRTA